MPTVTAQGKTFTCDRGANLRKELLKNNINLYNGNARIINCLGIGTCGTCAVAIEGEVSEPTWQENVRLSVFPHQSDNNRRLACQVQVLGDVKVTKYEGFWGETQGVKWTPDGEASA